MAGQPDDSEWIPFAGAGSDGYAAPVSTSTRRAQQRRRARRWLVPLAYAAAVLTAVVAWVVAVSAGEQSAGPLPGPTRVLTSVETVTAPAPSSPSPAPSVAPPAMTEAPPATPAEPEPVPAATAAVPPPATVVVTQQQPAPVATYVAPQAPAPAPEPVNHTLSANLGTSVTGGSLTVTVTINTDQSTASATYSLSGPRQVSGTVVSGGAVNGSGTFSTTVQPGPGTYTLTVHVTSGALSADTNPVQVTVTG